VEGLEMNTDTFCFDLKIPNLKEKMNALITKCKEKFPNIGGWTLNVTFWEDSDYQLELRHGSTEVNQAPPHEEIGSMRFSFFYNADGRIIYEECRQLGKSKCIYPETIEYEANK
jgi:hypothetical protein